MRNWYKLDNAATIYPSTLSKHYAAMFRMSVTLNEKIDQELLLVALKKVIKRFPNFHYQLKKGFFWCYFKYNHKSLIISEDKKNPLVRINFDTSNGYLFRIRYFNCRIAIEYFHALTDGHGGITFLLSLVAEYLKIKEKVKITYNSYVLDSCEECPNEELRDNFFKIARQYSEFEHNHRAFHFQGTKLPNNMLKIITGHLQVDALKKKCAQYQCTITEFLASVMLLVLQEMSEEKHNKKPLMVSIPVDLRRIYHINSLRNFSSYINIGIEPKYGHYDFDEIIKLVHSQMTILLNEKKINAKVTANVKAMKNVFIRLIPLFIKRKVLAFSEFLLGDRFCSINFSNLGLIDIPETMVPYIKDANFIIGRPRFNACNSSCLSIKNDLYISFARKIKEPRIERRFFCKLVELGLEVTIESNGGI